MALELLFGLSLGYQYSQSVKREAEVKQGKNDYFASLFQIQGASSLSTLAGRFVVFIPNPALRGAAALGNVLLPAASIVVFPVSAAIKQGHYGQGLKVVDAMIPSMRSVLPEKLDASRVKFFAYISENFTYFANVGVAAGAAALPFFGMAPLAAGIAVPVVFERLAAANYVPYRVNLAVEKVMPSVANAAMVAGGGLFSQAFSFLALAGGVPGVSDYMHKKVEKFILSKNGATLEEIDAPWVVREGLSMLEINRILENGEGYEINPAHCSKPALIGVELPEAHDFQSFLTLIDQIDWVKKYRFLKLAFSDDDRFIDMLKEKFPEVEKKALREDFESYVEKLAGELSKEEYLAQVFKGQMTQLVKVLCKEVPPKGFQYDLEDAIKSCSQILAHLLSGACGRVEQEDIFIKLGLEGGEYCARGIKRAAAEIAGGLSSTSEDPLLSYELKIRQHLQRKRQQIMQGLYQKLIEVMVRLAKEGPDMRLSKKEQTTDQHAVSIAQDVHNMDIFRNILGLGFCPLTENERRQFCLADLINWSLYADIRKEMYKAYQDSLEDAIILEGTVHFAGYMRLKIGSLPHLTQEQQEELIDKLSECSDGEATMRAYYRLFFVMQGVLKGNSLNSDWVEVEEDPVLSAPFDWELV